MWGSVLTIEAFSQDREWRAGSNGRRVSLLAQGEAFRVMSSRFDDHGVEAERYRQLYKTAEWDRTRKRKLHDNPCCERCMKQGYVEPAKVVHHSIAHKGDLVLFLDLDNLESLCKPHHDGEAQSEEKIGYSRAVDRDGWPIDPRHPTNSRERS